MPQAAEEEVHHLRRDRHFLQIVLALDDGVAIARDGRIAWASPRLAEISGVECADQLRGRPPETLLRGGGHALPSLAGGPLECRMRETGRRVRVKRIESGDDAGDESRREEIWVIADVERQLTLEGELLDTSRSLHAATRELAEAQARLEAQAADREELLSVVSHELRTPTTVIAGYNRLLLSEEVGSLSAEQRRFLEESSRSCARLVGFIRDLLEAAGHPDPAAQADVRVASLPVLVQGVIAYLRPLLEQAGLSVQLALDPAAQWACFDRPRIEQVLTNLLGNAMKYARSGGEIEIASRPISAAGQCFVEISVCDDGPGVPPSHRERIFEPYVRASDGRRAGGLGLGLAICRRIVEAHGGAITLSDRDGGGSRFAFTLPAARSRRSEPGGS